MFLPSVSSGKSCLLRSFCPNCTQITFNLCWKKKRKKQWQLACRVTFLCFYVQYKRDIFRRLSAHLLYPLLLFLPSNKRNVYWINSIVVLIIKLLNLKFIWAYAQILCLTTYSSKKTQFSKKKIWKLHWNKGFIHFHLG